MRDHGLVLTGASLAATPSAAQRLTVGTDASFDLGTGSLGLDVVPSSSPERCLLRTETRSADRARQDQEIDDAYGHYFSAALFINK